MTIQTVSRWLVLAIVLSFLFLPTFSQTYNFNEHVAPIVYNKCAICHHEGGIGPFPLTNYNEVRPYSPWIVHVITEKEMPPWPPDPDYRHFLDENYLTDDEIQMITDWSHQGSPEGPSFLEPQLPDFTYNHELGEPDIEITMQHSFVHLGNDLDSFRVFVFPLNNEEPLEVAAMELLCGNENLCHHGIFGFDHTGRAHYLDSIEAGYGYFNATNFGPGVGRNIMDVWVPGKKVRAYPDGTGHIIPPYSDLLVHMHYAPVENEESDRSTFRLYLADKPIERKIKLATMNFHKVFDGVFDIIPANTVRTFKGKIGVRDTISLIQIFPHQHLIGKSWEIWAEHPDGSTTNLIKIPQWDFHWQNWYTFEYFIKLQPGDTVFAIGTYDNTIFAHDQPNIPPIDIVRGLGSEDEMFLVKIAWVPYKEGDEKVYLGGELEVEPRPKPPSTLSFFVSPNPVTDWLITKVGLPAEMEINIHLVDFSGRLVKELMPPKTFARGRHALSFETDQVDRGVYFVVMKYGEKARAEKVILE